VTRQLGNALLIVSFALLAALVLTPGVSAQTPCPSTAACRPPTQVPEPATLWLMAASISALVPTTLALRRRRK